MGIWFTLNLAGFLSIDFVGIPGNILILGSFLHTLVCTRKITTAEIILSKLAFSNLLVVLTWGLPLTVQASGIHHVFDDLTCQVCLFLYCVGRAMSVSITSLLGCFQCIMIDPFPHRWLALKQNIHQHLYRIMIGLWCFNFLISSTRLMYSQVQVNATNTKYVMNYDFCVVVFPNYFLYLGNGIIYVVRDLFFLSLMTLSSSYLLRIFYLHGKRSLNTTHKKQAEMQAAKAVVTLVMMYIVSFGMDNVFWIYTLIAYPNSKRFTDARIFFDSCYSAISPIVIIFTNTKIQLGLKCITRKRELHSVNTISKHREN
ncbi:olfactory receptor class A-like protein 1 [Ambystoma mexicanum]|uniref:olfactory receptor class A-like protein 1 n=1 Tax=Ambystoma mexicanum TaxID=8296 RepID=UPI0037E7BD45